MDIREELSIYRQVIQFLDESTEAYLYLYDLVNGKIYFTDYLKYSTADLNIWMS